MFVRLSDLHPPKATLVLAKHGLVASSIAFTVLRLITALITIFSPVTVISVVILSARIGIERLIPFHVFASLSHSVLISRPIGDIVTIAGARLAVDLPTVIYPFIAVPVSITPVPV